MIRTGDIFTQYTADSRYSCVDCVSDEGESSKLRPSKPNGKVTLVWPNPKRDKSDIWIERTWQVADEYRLQHTSNIINLGTESFEIKPSINVTGWVDPNSVDVGMFSAQMKALSPACVVNDDFEEETAPELDKMEEEGEDVQLQGDIRWFGVNAQYFLMAALFSDEQGKGTCTMWADRMAPVARTLLEKMDKLETDGIDPFDDWYFDNLKQRLFPSWYWFGPPSEEIPIWLAQEEQREVEREDFANGYDIKTSFSPQWRSVDPWGVKDLSNKTASNKDSQNSEERVLVCVPSWLAGGRTMATIKGSIQTCDDAKKEQAGLETKRNQLGHSLTDPADTERVKHLNRVLPQYKKREKERLLAMTVFAGPKDLQLLEETSPALANSLDFWFVGFIAQPMLSFLRFTHRFVDSWALAIIILTVLVKLLLLPLTHKSFTQMQRMQQLKPEMDALRKKFKDDKKKQQVEMMNLYKRHRINPLGGCLPMMLQMPVYIALYRTIYSSVDLYQQPLFSAAWIPDMTMPDPLFILPIALGLFMVVQQMLSPMGAGGDEMQQKIIKWMMPIMFGGFMLFLPSGLVLYIFVNTFLTIIQQWMIRRKIAAKAG